MVQLSLLTFTPLKLQKDDRLAHAAHPFTKSLYNPLFLKIVMVSHIYFQNNFRNSVQPAQQNIEGQIKTANRGFKLAVLPIIARYVRTFWFGWNCFLLC